MQALIDFIISVADRLWPWATVDPWEEGIRVRTLPFLGQWVKKIKPGAVFTLPFFDGIETINVKRQIADLPDQDVETSDRVSMKISASVVYSIRHAERTWLDTQEHDEAITLIAMEAIASFVNTTRYEHIYVDAIRTAVLPVVRQAAWKWGVEVEAVGITHLSKQRVYSITTS